MPMKLEEWKRTLRLTRFANSYALQVVLPAIVKVLQAGDVETISDPHIELLQLDLS